MSSDSRVRLFKVVVMLALFAYSGASLAASGSFETSKVTVANLDKASDTQSSS